MKTVVLLIFILLVSSKRVTNATVEVSFDSLGSAYLNYENQYVNLILNSEKFNLPDGYIKATFDINDHHITLLDYKPMPLPKLVKSVKSDKKHSAMFGVTLYIGVVRAAFRTNTNACVAESKVREYVRYVELGMKLWTGNQVRISQGDDLYISSQCIVIDDAIYEEANVDKVINSLMDATRQIETLPNVAIRWFITSDFKGDYIGLSLMGGPARVANRNQNYWLIVKGNHGEDPNNGRVYTLIHEYGHSCGLDHTGTRDSSLTGAFYDFNTIDNYGDCGSYMGNCADWYQTVTMPQYYAVTVNGNPESWFFKDAEPGVHKYRMYATDHPYSRYFLGTNEQFHDDDKSFDRIAFKYNCLAIRIFVNTSFTSKYAGDEGTNGQLFLEYKYLEKGLKGSADFGLRILSGANKRTNLFDANFDNIPNFGDSHIIQGIDYYPADFDTGTLRIRVTKIHKTTLKESLEEEIVKEDKRTFYEPSYAEVEIEAYPNVPPPVRSPPDGLPTIITSPFFHNCIKTNDGSGYSCIRNSQTTNGWFYFVNEENRNKNHPRFYRSGNAFLKGRNAIRSYTGSDNSNIKICYGDNGSKCISVSTKSKDYGDLNRRNYQNAHVTKAKDGKVEDLGRVNMLFGMDLKFPTGSKAYVTDLYGNKKDITIINNMFVEILPVLETDGFAEGAVVIEDKDGVVTYFQFFDYYHQENGNRVAIGYNQDGDIELTPACMPNNKYSTTSTMLYPVIFKENEWHFYPISYLKETDYVFIDFKATIPNGLIMTVETDMGEYIRDLSEFGGLNNISYKLTFMELHYALSSWGEIDRIKFNKEIEILNIRPVFVSTTGDQMKNVNSITEGLNFNGYRYEVQAPSSLSTYIYNKGNAKIFGKEYTFDTSTTVFTIPKSLFRYSDDDETTKEWLTFFENDYSWRLVIPSLPPKTVTTRYYRNTFTIPDIERAGPPLITINYDDGIIIYINGNEIFRRNLPSGEITSTTAGIESGRKLEKVSIPFIVIQEGINYIAIEIHSHDTSSKNDFFSCTIDSSETITGSSPITTEDNVEIEMEKPVEGKFTIIKDVKNMLEFYKEIVGINFNSDTPESEHFPFNFTFRFTDNIAHYFNEIDVAGCTNSGTDYHPKNIKVFGSTDSENPNWEEIYSNEDLGFKDVCADDLNNNKDELDKCCTDRLKAPLIIKKSYESYKLEVIKINNYDITGNNYLQFRLFVMNLNTLPICKTDSYGFPSVYAGGTSILKINSEIFYRKCNENGEWGLSNGLKYSDDNQETNEWIKFFENDYSWRLVIPSLPPKTVTTRYYRNIFTIPDIERAGPPLITINYDDGIIIYINGNEIFRRNLPSGEITSTTNAIKKETKLEKVSIPLPIIQEGINYIAIEIHKSSESPIDQIDSFSFAIDPSKAITGSSPITTEDNVEIEMEKPVEGKFTPKRPPKNMLEYYKERVGIVFDKNSLESEHFPFNFTFRFKDNIAHYFNEIDVAGCTNDNKFHPKNIKVFGSTDSENPNWEEIYSNEDLNLQNACPDASNGNKALIDECCTDRKQFPLIIKKSYESYKLEVIKINNYGKTYNYIQIRLFVMNLNTLPICKTDSYGFPSVYAGGTSILKINSEILTRKCNENGVWEIIIPTT